VATSDAVVPWLIVAAAILIASATTAVWVVGQCAEWADTGRWPPTGWSLTLLPAAAGSGPWPWPSTHPSTVQLGSAALLGVLLAGAGLLSYRSYLRTPRSDSFYRALGRPGLVAHLGLTAQQVTASRLRRTTLAAVKPPAITAQDVGLALGHVDTGNGPGPMVYAGWEDVVLAVMAPRSGKTTSVAIPAICSAPGAVVATSNKLDILHTAALRHKITGTAPWVFDPQGVARTPQTWWWDPLDAVTTVEEAERLAGHFIAEVADEKDSIWSTSATELLSGLLLAANLTRSTITTVYTWLADEHDPAPVAALEAGGFDVLAGSLRGLSHAAPETRASVYFTARSGARCLRNPQITAWVTPPRRSLPRLDPDQFVGGRGTLYLLSKDSGGSAAPLVAALTDRVMRAGVRQAEARGGRLDPPLVVVLDEAASVAPIRDLPTLYSHFGSRGILPVTILQSLPQGETVWGKTGMAALWSAATIKLVGAGTDDEDTASRISRLVGDHDVAVVSVSTGRGGSRSTSLTNRPVLTAAQVRALPKGTALLLATGTPAVLLRLHPYYAGPHATAIDTEAAALTARIAAHPATQENP
jgi:type IV secretory pathway TraG/TraD family ATPase VirD4